MSDWLRPMTGHWVDAARTELARHAALVRVTVIALRGSAPREAGATMLVDAQHTQGTIGGGRLEWHATAAARRLLQEPAGSAVRLEDLTLGPELGQCCGGRVELWLERLTRDDLPWLDAAARRRHESGLRVTTEYAAGRVAHRLVSTAEHGATLRRTAPDHIEFSEPFSACRRPLWVFGAGHVGQALVRLLADLDQFDIGWFDARADLLPGGLPSTVSAQLCPAPVARVTEAPPGTCFAVMTHDHALDYALCRAVLQRADSAWLGLIGSAGKRARFRSRLRRDGIDPRTLDHLTCPIGLSGIASKLPAAIAIGIAAQLLQLTSAAAAAPRRDEAAQAACAEPCAGCTPQRRSAP